MKEGLKRGAKRKAKEFLTKEVAKRAKKYKDTFCVKKKKKDANATHTFTSTTSTSRAGSNTTRGVVSEPY